MTGLSFGGEAYGGPASNLGETEPNLSPDYTFLIGRSRADALVPPMPDFTIGETTTFEVLFKPNGLPDHLGRYNQVRDRLMYANGDSVHTDTVHDSTPWYTERHRNETLLVKCISGRDLNEVRDVWGVIRGGSDSTHYPGTGTTLSVNVYVLSELQDYDSRRDVQERFER